jgi:EAL and modified HD-GYP domain-containing signal transduction protein
MSYTVAVWNSPSLAGIAIHCRAISVTHPASKGNMNRFLARQPILTANTPIFGYEILSRYGPENFFRPAPGNASDVNAMDELFLMGLKQMTHGLPAFLNCTRDFLLKNYLELLPRENVVGEILETVEPDADVLAACKHVKNQGYRLALDDYEDRPELAPFLALADFVKIDFLTTSLAEQKRLGQKFRRLGIPLIAEKVESHEQFHRGRDMGYELFQGYFFCRPEMVTRRGVPANKLVCLHLLRAATRQQIDLTEIANLIKQELSLSYRLLRYLNSPLFSFVGEVHSIPHALRLLGERPIQKWISLVSVAAMADDKPGELVRMPLVRARFCELLAEAADMEPLAGDLFLLGLLSLLDAMLNMPMAQVLADLPVNDEIRNALNGQPSRFRAVFEVVLHYETGTWEQLEKSAHAAGVNEAIIPEIYSNALAWADGILSEPLLSIAQ